MRAFEIKPLESIRSVADALEELRAAGVMRDGETAHFRTKCMKLRDGRRLASKEPNWL